MGNGKVRKLVSVASVIAIAVCVMHLTTPTAQAAPAVVIKADGSCFLPGVDGNGNLSFANGALGDAMLVANGNKLKFSCKAKVTNESGKAQNFTVRVVIPGEGRVFSAKLTVSASGQATGQASFKP